MNQNLLEMDWESALNASTAEDIWTFLASMINDQMRKYIPKLAPSKDKRRYTWMYCKSKLKNKTGLSDDHEKGEIRNRYFTSVFTREDIDTIPIMNERQESVTLRYIINIPDLAEKKLNKLNLSKSVGQDGFHPRILKELSSIIKMPLHILFNGRTST